MKSKPQIEGVIDILKELEKVLNLNDDIEAGSSIDHHIIYIRGLIGILEWALS